MVEKKQSAQFFLFLIDLERALQNMQKADNVQAMYEGIDLISQKFLKVLAQEGLQKMEPVGETFRHRLS